MEVVTQFNTELKSILGFRPPISRAKMAIITKLAIKSAKLYKHIVMHVERFIAKCPPDFKVPGLYVIDSVVRQSKHQLGAEKDVYGPRFTRNFLKTFQHIFECTEEDRPKIVRVLNLWQKNGVFTPEVIQPLLSLAPASNGNGTSSEQWQSSAAIPSPGSHPLKGLGRMTPSDNSARNIGTLDRQRSLPDHFNTPPSAPFTQAPPPRSPSPEPIMAASEEQRYHQAPEPMMEDTPPRVRMGNVGLSHQQAQQQLFDQALLNDFDYSDEDDDREGMRAQELKGMQAREAGLSVEGMRPEGELAGMHQQAPPPPPPPAILTNDPTRLHPTAPNIQQYPPGGGHPMPPQQVPQQSQPPPQNVPPNHALPPHGGHVVPPPHALPPSHGYPPFQGGHPGYHVGPQPPFHGGPPPPHGGGPPSSYHGGPPPRGPQGGPPPHGPPPPHIPPHGGPLQFHSGPPPPIHGGPHNGPPPHGYGPPHGFPPPSHGYPPSRGPPLSLGHPPHGPPQPRPLHGPPPNLPQSPSSSHPGFFPGGPGGPPSRDLPPQGGVNYGHRSSLPPLGPGPPPPPPPYHHPPPSNPQPSGRLERFSPPPFRGHSPSPPRRMWRERERDNTRERDRDNTRERDRDNTRERERENTRERDRDNTRERERWTSPPRRRSRSPMREQKSRSPVRNRESRDSRSPPPSRRRSADIERHRKGGAHPKEEHYTVCSTTIWVGHIPKSVAQNQIAEAFEDFGTVKSVDVVQARGCAYVVMLQRSEAARALNSLRDLKLNGTACKLAWAPGRGVKSATFKNYWDIELGISFIPWEKVKSQEELDSVVEGGWIDPATCPPGMKPATQTKGETAASKQDLNLSNSSSPLLPPGMPGLPSNLSQPMFSASAGPLNMAVMHGGMGAPPPPFGMAPSPGISGTRYHPPTAMPHHPVQAPSGPPSQFFVRPMTSHAPPPESAFDATTDVDMQLDDAENLEQESGTVQGNTIDDAPSSGAPYGKQEESNNPVRAGFEDVGHVDSQGSERAGSDDPEHESLDACERDVQIPQSNTSAALGLVESREIGPDVKKAGSPLCGDSPVLSPDDFQMSDDPNAYSDGGRHHSDARGGGNEDNEESNRLPKGTES